MNKIIITGHPESGCGSAEYLLLASGFGPALPSGKDGLLPKDIHQSLRAVYPVPECHTITDEKGFLPLSISQAYQEMASDSPHSGNDEMVRCWSDPDAIFFLKFWQAADPGIFFLFLYDSPASVLRNIRSNATHSKDLESAIRRQLDNWAVYNRALLHFLHENTDRCILLHAEHLRNDPAACIRFIWEKTGIQPVVHEPSASVEDAILDVAARMQAAPPHEAIDRFLAEYHMDFDTAHGGLYEELQAASSLPVGTYEDGGSFALAAIKARVMERVSFASQTETLSRKCLDLEREQQGLLNDLELTLLQHAQACEELEHVLLENGSLRLDLQERSKPQPVSEPPPRMGAVERVKNHLSYRLGAIMVSKAGRPLGILSLPFTLTLEVLLFHREKANNGKVQLPPLHEYADAHLAAEVKKQLPYRLGNALIRRGRNPMGWIILPFALLRQIQASQRTRANEP